MHTAFAILMLVLKSNRGKNGRVPRFIRVVLKYISVGFSAFFIYTRKHPLIALFIFLLLCTSITVFIFTASNHASPKLSLNPAVSEYQQQLPVLKSKAENDPKNADAQKNYAIALYASGEIADAKTQYQKAIAASPNDASLHNNLANAYRDLGNSDAAVQEYVKAIALDPKLLNAYTNLANVQLYTQNQPQAAIRTYTQALEVFPNNSTLQLLLGKAYEKTGDTANAQSTYEQIIERDPQNTAAQQALNGLAK